MIFPFLILAKLLGECKKKLRINFIEQTCLPIFNTIKEVAEIILDKNFECFYGEKQFTGMATDEGNIMGIIRMDIKDNGPLAMMSIINLNQKSLASHSFVEREA